MNERSRRPAAPFTTTNSSSTTPGIKGSRQNVSVSTFGSSSSLLSLCRALDNAESSSSSTDFIHPQAAARASMKKTNHGLNQYMGPSQHSASTGTAHNNSIRNNAIWPTLDSNHMESNFSNPYALASLDVSNSINQLHQLQALASFDVNKSINQLQQLQQQLMNFSTIQNLLSATATTYGPPTLLASDSHPLHSSSLPLDPLVLPLNPSNVPNIYPSNNPQFSSVYASQQTAAFLRSVALQANHPNVPILQNPLLASSAANGPLDYMNFFNNAESALYNLSSSQPLQLDLTNRNKNNNQEVLETSNIASPTSLMRLLSDRRLPSAPQQLDAIPPEFWLLNGSNEEVATTLTRLRNGLESSDSSSEDDNIDSGTPEPIPRFKPNSETDRKWMERYVELCQYKEQNGDCLVPDGYAKNPPLARWVREQRGQYKRAMAGKSSYMSQQRMEALQKLDFTWSLRDKVEWKLRYEELLMFKSQHGHCLVPSHYEQNVKLGTWVANQRKHYRLYQEGKQNMMTQNRIDMLNEVGFKWSLRVTRKRKKNAS